MSEISIAICLVLSFIGALIHELHKQEIQLLESTVFDGALDDITHNCSCLETKLATLISELYYLQADGDSYNKLIWVMPGNQRATIFHNKTTSYKIN